MYKVWLCTLIVFFSIGISAQDIDVKKRLSNNFSSYNLEEIDLRDLNARINSISPDVNLIIPEAEGNGEYHLELFKTSVVADDYILTVYDGNSVVTSSGIDITVMDGYISGRPETRAYTVVGPDYFFAYIDDGREQYYYEPLSLYGGALSSGNIVIYKDENVKATASTCGSKAFHQHTEAKRDKTTTRAGECFIVDYAVASDFEMYKDFNNSVSQVEAFVISITGLMNGDYDTSFDDELRHSIVQNVVSTSMAGDEWLQGGNPANIDELLNEFTAWGPGNMVSHDVASLWTGFNLSGNTVGLAWVGVVCSGFRYNVLEHFTSNTNSLRVLTSHELGHNYNAVHDSGNGFIMSPSVNNTTQWSTVSVNAINGYYTPRAASCFISCGGGGGGPDANFSFNITSSCVPGQVEFTDISTGNPTSWSWTFQGGVPSTSSERNPVVSYPQSGSYDVTLSVTNNEGSDDITKSNIVVIYDQPVADFTYQVTGQEVSFTNNSIDATDYMWDFGNGQTSTLPNPVIDYGENGSFTVSLTASNNCDSDEASQIVVTGGPPNVNFTYSATDVCVGESITFTDASSGNPTSWLWGFEGGSPSSSTQESQVVQYITPGQFNVSLTASNDIGQDSGTLNDLITVSGSPEADFSFEVNGNEVIFENLSLNATDYIWSFGNNQSSTVDNPVVNYDEPGSYNVRLIASSECGNDDIIKVVVVGTLPVVNLTYSATDVCVGESITFTDVSSGNPTSRLWTFEGGSPSTSTQETQVVQYLTQGQYDVSLTVSNASGEDSEFLNELISVTSPPIADFDFQVDGNEVTFNNLSINATEFIWSFGNNQSSTISNPVTSYDGPGSYNVRLIASNDCSDDEIIKTIVIVGHPEASFSSSETNICTGQSVEYFDNSTGSPSSRLWTFEGGTPDTSITENPTVQYLLPGQYNVTLSVTNDVGTDVAESIDYIQVVETVIADFTYVVNGGEVTFQNQSSSGQDYTWDFGDGGTSTMVSPVYTFQEAGTYTISLSAENECSLDIKSMDITIVFLPIAGIEIDGSANICEGGSVQFLNASSENVESFLWEFEGGVPATSTDANPMVQYNDAGIFDVSLTVTNSEGSDVELSSEAIEVLMTTQADFNYILEGGSLTVQNASVNATEYSWDFGDGTISALGEPTHTYEQDGTYILSLEVNGPCGIDVKSDTIEVLLPPVALFEINENEVCAATEVTITNLSQGGNLSYMWSSDGASISDQFSASPTFTYDVSGTYNITLTVSNDTGSDSYTINEGVRVFGGVHSDIGFTNDGLQVIFANNSNDGIHFWKFGDGNDSEAFSPVYTYTEEGIYDVTHSVMNACGTDSSSLKVNLFTLPEAEFTINTSSGCAPLEVQVVNGSSDNTVSYSWLSEGAEVESNVDSDPLFTYNQAGDYSIMLVAINPAGSDTMYLDGVITVIDTVSADFSYSKDMLSVNFNASITEAEQYKWNFGDGTSAIGKMTEHTYTTEGTYTVELQVQNTCGITTSSQSIVVNTLPSADFSVEQNEICNGGSLQYNEEASSNSMEFQWMFEGGIPEVSNEPNPLVNYPNHGIYDVQLIVTGVEGSDTLVKNDFVHIGGPPELESEVTLDGNLIIINNLTEEVISSSFVLGNDTIPGNSIEYAASKNGMVSITLMSENECGISSEIINTEIDVFPTAILGMEAIEICTGENLVFPEREIREGDEYQWTISNTDTVLTAEGLRPEINLNVEGVYDLKLLVKNEYGVDSVIAANFINVIGLIDAAFEYEVESNQIIAQATVVGEYIKKWDMGDGTILEGMSIEHTYQEDGVYDVVFSAENQCGVDTSMIRIEVLTSSISENISDNLNIYPNPVSDIVTIEYVGNQAINVDLININGYKLDDYSIIMDRSKVNLNVSDLPAATYLIKITSDSQVLFRKLVVVK
ncbi:MAG: PKD domain-containing protein [Saprospiraceae bacterium]|nr:PKD domain-containing protein [Saprospiraceae bacterium]